MPDYDISNAFARIEDELISSMFRNFSHHRAEETKEGFNWEMWQVRQLKALDEYRRANKKIFTKKFANLNTRIDQFIKQARSDGAAKQEIAMLEAMKKGYKTRRTFRGNARIAADFIKLNDRKMDALINATTHDLERAEHAMLRMANDQYRKIIFDAQVYALSGAGTYEKAVDMAARDFLKAGINCIAYKNGARHTIQDYVSMVLSTTGKRAYLTGEGEMRKQWGESLVIMNKRGNPCPLCAPFVGKVLVDDVWSGGKPDGIHLLMSTAIDKGLYHPRCKDGHTTYFEGISDEGEPYTESERRELTEQYNAEQKSNYAKNQAEKCARIAKYSLDSENKKVYAERAEKWRGIAEESVDKSGGSGIIKERNKKSITAITDNSIEKVPEVKIQGYTDEQCKFIKSQHQELLKYSRDNNGNKEVAFVFDCDLSNRKEFMGSDDKIDFGSTLYGKDLFIMHNHPRNSSYSDYDIQFFTTNANVKSLSIIKNNGNVEVISKTDSFTVDKMKTAYKRAFKKYVEQGTNEEIDKAIEYMLKKNGGILKWIR